MGSPSLKLNGAGQPNDVVFGFERLLQLVGGIDRLSRKRSGQQSQSGNGLAEEESTLDVRSAVACSRTAA